MSAMQMNTLEDAIFAWVLAGSGLTADKISWAVQNQRAPSGTCITLRMRAIRGVGSDWLVNEDNYTAYAGQVFTANAAANQLAIAAHGLATGDGPLLASTTGVLPANLAAATNYWAVVDTTGLIRVATTQANAVAVTPVVVDIGDAGTGVHTLTGAATFTRQGAGILRRLRGNRRVTLTITCYADTAIGADGPMSIVADVVSAARLPSRGDALAVAGVGISDASDVLAIEGVVGNTTIEPRASTEVVFYATSELVETATYIEHVVVTNEVPAPDEPFTI